MYSHDSKTLKLCYNFSLQMPSSRLRLLVILWIKSFHESLFLKLSIAPARIYLELIKKLFFLCYQLSRLGSIARMCGWYLRFMLKCRRHDLRCYVGFLLVGLNIIFIRVKQAQTYPPILFTLINTTFGAQPGVQNAVQMNYGGTNVSPYLIYCYEHNIIKVLSFDFLFKTVKS